MVIIASETVILLPFSNNFANKGWDKSFMNTSWETSPKKHSKLYERTTKSSGFALGSL